MCRSWRSVGVCRRSSSKRRRCSKLLSLLAHFAEKRSDQIQVA
jgi:hypothetical protein